MFWNAQPLADTGATTTHPAQIARTTASGAQTLLGRGRAGWHGGARLAVPQNLSLPTLPPNAPDSNPAKIVWQYLRSDKRAINVFDGCNATKDACRATWQSSPTTPKSSRQFPPTHKQRSIFRAVGMRCFGGYIGTTLQWA